MSKRAQQGNAGRNGFLNLLRGLERRASGKPPIGKARRLREEVVDLGQDPFTSFPRQEMSAVDLKTNPPKVRPRFLGFFGPFGPLPLPVTSEVLRWVRSGDNGFVRFLDIFAARFIQLFYRSWSNARAITQFDHPTGGDFPEHLRALTGEAGASFADRGAVDDVIRLRYTALAMGRVRTPVKLRALLRAHFGLQVRIDEFVSSWMDFSPEDLSCMGRSNMGLGQTIKLGARTATTSDKITVHLECATSRQYRAFLPGRRQHAELIDLITSYLGPFVSVEVAVWLPKHHVTPAQLGKTAELGWMTALIDDAPAPATIELVEMCRYRVAMAA